ncbi:MAG: UTP--glucose-1-phosphate uridylyltransferase GalU [Oscillospiraceae bacterium]|jgi:UTP--glucose-1-phosphate uridylyltransferase|nr:UTP--glucose-1-phosphate uridylyltransferase GalU [Oscillospiraceae bacterium]
MKVKKAVIPAAGLGTRMLPATKSIPKEMLPVVDKPAIQYIVEEAVNSGIEDILIITNRGKSAIEDYFDYSPEVEASLEKSGKISELNLVRASANLANMHFIRQKETKGLGHSILCAKSFVGNEPFAVLLGDDIMVSEVPVTKQLIDASEKYNASSVGAQQVDLGVIHKYCSLKIEKLEEKIFKALDVIEKPSPDKVFSNYAILGRYVLTPAIFDILEKTSPGFGGEIQLTDGLAELCKIEDMVAVDFDAKRYDTGNLQGFLEATIEFALKDPSVNTWLREYLKMHNS